MHAKADRLGDLVDFSVQRSRQHIQYGMADVVSSLQLWLQIMVAYHVVFGEELAYN